jgi:hypothetical protein
MSNSKDLAEGVLAVVKAAVGPVIERLKLLEAEVRALKSRKAAPDSSEVAAEIRARLQGGRE